MMDDWLICNLENGYDFLQIYMIYLTYAVKKQCVSKATDINALKATLYLAHNRRYTFSVKLYLSNR